VQQGHNGHWHGTASEERAIVFADTLTKAGRLVQMQRMFATRPNRGFRTAEIAERLGIAPRTVRKYITWL
jgi:DNA-binding NarL/FixJ family response regulator